MKTRQICLGIDPFDDPLDRMLAEVALAIQLPPSLHRKAVDRYEAVRNHLESTSCHFNGHIEHFYPQGSMAIDATISNRGTDDEYDIDIIAQLCGRFRGMRPLQMLLELETALTGYRGMRIERQTRCVTLFYADGMHLDVTPALRDGAFTPDRQSRIPHAKGPQVSADDTLVPTNAYGFVEWYKASTPVETRLVKAFNRRWIDEEAFLRADAEVDEVPDQTAFVVKNTATVALQLLKRYRNVRYANRPGRMPPSVMLSHYAASLAKQGHSLTDMLIILSSRIVRDIEASSALGRLLHVANPTYGEDVFTDRWPGDQIAQARFAKDLRDLVEGLQRVRRAGMLPDAMTDWLRETFGDRVVTKAVHRNAERTGRAIQTGTQGYSRIGQILVPASASLALPSKSAANVTGSRHTFFGDLLK